MKVLVTGGGGFLGSAICKQLVAAGYTVCAFNRTRHAGLDDLKVEQRIGDIGHLDTVCDATADIDAVVHSAGKVGAWGKLEDFYDTNVRGTDNLLAACELNESTSSCSPRARPWSTAAAIRRFDESAPYATHFSSPYAQTKALAEQRVLAANGHGSRHRRTASAYRVGTGRSEFPAAHSRAGAQGTIPTDRRCREENRHHLIDNAANAHVLALQKTRVGSPIAGNRKDTYALGQQYGGRGPQLERRRALGAGARRRRRPRTGRNAQSRRHPQSRPRPFPGRRAGRPLGHPRRHRRHRGVLAVQFDLHDRSAGSRHRNDVRQARAELETSGLHFLWWPIQDVERVTITENQTEIGSVATAHRRAATTA